MKASLAIAVGAVALSFAGMPLAQDAKAPASHPHATATQSGPSTNTSHQMGQMDEHMTTMQALHDRMMGASTPEERQKVMDEQRIEMQACMGMMRQMQADAMTGGMGPGMMVQKGKPADAGAQMQMMQKRMDMMQMMMQTMMDRQEMMTAPKSPDIAPRK
jgi:hypothetical protein